MDEQLAIKVLENPWVQRIINLLFEEGKKFFKDLSEKERIQWGIAFEEYLKKTNESFSKTKTLLCRNTPIHIYEFYECISLKKINKMKDYEEEIVDTYDIRNILDIGNKILITGSSGIGKTIMMKHFFLNTIEKTSFIPVLIELRKINELKEKNFNLEKYLINILKEYDLKLEDKYFKCTFNEGYYVFLFDGVDEVEKKLREKLKLEIDKFSFKYDKNYYIISSRPSSEFVSWNKFIELESMYLTKKQAINIINKLKYDKNIKNKFSQALEDGLFENYYTFASIPLLLTIMFLTFEVNASIPNKLNDFYEQAFSVLFYRHDATKDCYVRKINSNLEYTEFKKAFSKFCFNTYFKNKYIFTHSEIIKYIEEIKFKKLEITKFKPEDFLEDLIVSLCLIVEEGINYRFVHRSFQEYFSAVYFKEFPDEQQKEFFILCLKNDRLEYGDKFYSILLEIQKDRFLQNIVSTYLKITKEEMNKNIKFKRDDKRKVCLYFFKEFRFMLKGNKIHNIKIPIISKINNLLFFIKILELDNKWYLTIEDKFCEEVEKIFKVIYKNNIKKKEISFYELFSNDEFWNLFDKKYIESLYLIWKKLDLFYKRYQNKYKKNLTFDDFLNRL